MTKMLEVRRHAMRRKPGAHLSREGIDLARFVGGSMGNFDRVIASELPRACETAVAMGFEIDRSIETLGVISDGLLRAAGWPSPISKIAESVRSNRNLADFAESQADAWRGVLNVLEEGEDTALIISHGAIMELGLLAATECRDAERHGGVFGYCEGFRLFFDGLHCVSSEMLRLPEGRRLLEN